MRKLTLLCCVLLILSCAENKKEKQEIELTKTVSGVFLIQATLNGVVTVPMILDTGASTSTIPLSLFYLLLDLGTITKADLLPPITTVLADGSRVVCGRFNLRTLKIGDTTFKNVEVNVFGNKSGILLLGQSSLSRFGVIQFNYENNTMIINSAK